MSSRVDVRRGRNNRRDGRRASIEAGYANEIPKIKEDDVSVKMQEEVLCASSDERPDISNDNPITKTVDTYDFKDINLDDIACENDDNEWVEYLTFKERIASIDWNNRATRIKASIALVLTTFLLTAFILCLMIQSSLNSLQEDMNSLKNELESYKENSESSDNSETEELAGSVDLTDDTRYVYLTFDDGPSTKTDAILDILDEYDVKATFFVCGKNGFDDEYKRIVDEGHTIAMHSYSHDYDDIYASLDNFQTDLHKLQNYIYDITGTWTTYYRFPGGSSNTISEVDMDELIDYLGRENITYFDWNVYGGDNVSSDIIVSNVTNSIEEYSNCIILLHDAADKEETVKALPDIIEYIQGLDNTEIVPITDESVPVQHKK